ncbi:MAG: hypothetical protein HY306_12530 [Nitrosomonadales bacterium]|nr:hypothetical protein [Nitrosomonadales bacterium]
MKFQHLFVAAVAAVFLSGTNAGQAKEKIDAAIETVKVTVAADNEKTGRLNETGTMVIRRLFFT